MLLWIHAFRFRAWSDHSSVHFCWELHWVGLGMAPQRVTAWCGLVLARLSQMRTENYCGKELSRTKWQISWFVRSLSSITHLRALWSMKSQCVRSSWAILCSVRKYHSILPAPGPMHQMHQVHLTSSVKHVGLCRRKINKSKDVILGG